MNILIKRLAWTLISLSISAYASAASPDRHSHFCNTDTDVCVLIQADASLSEYDTATVTITGDIVYEHKPVYQPSPISEPLNENHDVELFFHNAKHLTDDRARTINVKIDSINQRAPATNCTLEIQHSVWQPAVYTLQVSQKKGVYRCRRQVLSH